MFNDDPDFIHDALSRDQAEFDSEFGIDLDAHSAVFLRDETLEDLARERFEWGLERIRNPPPDEFLSEMYVPDAYSDARVNKDFEHGIVNIARMDRDELVDAMRNTNYSVLANHSIHEDWESPFLDNQAQNIP